MKRVIRWVVLGTITVLVAACSVLGGDKKASDEPERHYAATISVAPYDDVRGISNPRKIGVGAENLTWLSGLGGTDIVLEQDVATLVHDAMNKRLRQAGYQVVKEGAMFELSGKVKVLTYNVKARDEVTISIESTLKDTATGKVLWSGVVDEQQEHFAGITGGSMADVVDYLNHELGVVAKKTSDSIDAVLMAQRPELFEILPGTKVIPGVKVLNAPVAPAVTSGQKPAAANMGLLVIGTDPKGAKVYIDKVYYGMSPLRLDMEPGIHTISVGLDGYRKVSQKVSVRKGDTTDLELKLKKH